MCDEHTQKDVDDFLGRAGVTRRQFGKLSAAAGLAMMWPLALEAWSLTRHPLPDYRREDAPVRLVRRSLEGDTEISR